jgi:hypothetical protein
LRGQHFLGQIPERCFHGDLELLPPFPPNLPEVPGKERALARGLGGVELRDLSHRESRRFGEPPAFASSQGRESGHEHLGVLVETQDVLESGQGLDQG